MLIGAMMRVVSYTTSAGATQRGHLMKRAATVLFLALTLAFPASAAWAHEGEDEPAKTLVMEAIALLRGQPDQLDAIMDKMHDALEAEDTEGVDLDLVEQADAAFEDGQMHESWDLLEEAIGAEPHRIATGAGDVSGSEPTEAPAPVIHERELAGGPRWPSSDSNWILLAVAGIFLFAGGVVVGKVH